jgi:hypothetical protein
MIRPWRSIALLVVLLTLAGCATGSSGSAGGSPRVRCLSDPGRDASATNRPLFFLFCMESP